MADTSKTWMNDWMESQQGYWKAWGDLAQRGMKAPEAPKNPLADGINQWWQAVSPMTPPSGRDVFDKVMDVSRGYFTLAEQFMSGVGGGGKDVGMEAVNGWLENMQKMWTSPTPNLFGANNPGKGFNTFWDLPMDTWQRLAANIVPMPGDYTQAYHPEGANAARDQMNRFLSIPTVGYTRESQEQFQILAQRQMDYASATQTYQMAFGNLGAETARKFQAALQARAADNKPIHSLRELYDQWVEMSEAAYAEFVMTEEYQKLYGHLVNSLLGLKQQMARMVDQNLEAMHMPTHAEISTLQCRQQELRRDNLRLHKEIKEIHKQLEAMRKASITTEAAPEAAPAAKRAPAARTKKAGDAK
ncbi:MAG: class III poly(R)-hydroxyalkanoic acid synthase subunit PhaE [Gammaproteobacteria bacterium]|nr:class III poly(R)-hydroxyalkanoic acid synthase subunit PhaE [Gammaproteobacteria bacterium]